MKISLDLHIHSRRSPDGRMSLEEIAAAARQRGLDAVAICDHDLSYSGPPSVDGVLMIPGVEVSTDRGHLLGLFVEGVDGTRSFLSSAQAIREAGGVAVLAHPFQRPREEEELLPLAAHLDGVEVWNSRADRKDPLANAKAAALARKTGLPPFAGSDAHLPQEIGSGRILVQAQALTLPALRAALLAGGGEVSGVDSPALCVARSQYTKLKKTNASPLRWGKWTAFAAKCVLEDFRRSGRRTTICRST